MTFAGNGTNVKRLYRVEARVRNFFPENPVKLCDGILSTEWREVYFNNNPNPAGVPSTPDSDMFGLLPYESATALAWTIIAQRPYASIECRLVQYQLAITHTLNKRGEVDEIIKEVGFRDIKIQEQKDNGTQA